MNAHGLNEEQSFVTLTILLQTIIAVALLKYLYNKALIEGVVVKGKLHADPLILEIGHTDLMASIERKKRKMTI